MVSKPPASTAKSSSSSGSRFSLTSLTSTANDGLLAGEVLGLVVLGEGHLDLALVAGGGALELLLEALDQPAGAELEQVAAGVAALERLAVDRCRRSRSPRSRPSRPGAPRSRARRATRAGARAPAWTSSGDTSGSRRPYLDALAVAERGLRPHAHLDREGERRALLGQLVEVDLGVADGGDARLVRSACSYQPGRPWRTASSSTASRPTWRITTCGGTLPLRKPGTRISPPMALAAALSSCSSASAGTSTSTRTRESPSVGGGCLDRRGHGRVTIAWRPCSAASPNVSRPGSSRDRSATCGAPWRTSWCSSRARGSRACVDRATRRSRSPARPPSPGASPGAPSCSSWTKLRTWP